MGSSASHGYHLLEELRANLSKYIKNRIHNGIKYGLNVLIIKDTDEQKCHSCFNHAIARKAKERKEKIC